MAASVEFRIGYLDYSFRQTREKKRDLNVAETGLKTNRKCSE